MKWTFKKPTKPGNYWYKHVERAMPGISSKPIILYVNSDLCVPQMDKHEFKEPISVEEYNGQWAGPIELPEDQSETDNLAALLWELNHLDK